ncbi:MAG: GNAT family N-acetyltransferase [Gemmatimonas sp.]|jgi:ribosomal-protein-alanine N-acetyltransferase|nr:GNAT family N-acetyltransferase [Gemmatimonas sp.]MCA2986683.1 GNAT family N-acetyltransferase [Gemmatimonas sp.]MCA2993859.1 GNAT family N-acetyltransferase [Gemmatimonas sp.]
MTYEPHTYVRVTDRVVYRWIQAWRQGGGALASVVELRETKALAGIVEVSIAPHGAILGFIFSRSYWRVGYAAEAVKAVIDVAFESFHVWRVWATCATENEPSRPVLEKCRLEVEGTLRRWVVSPLVSPIPRDSFCVAITKEEWLTQGSLPRGSIENPVLTPHNPSTALTQ